MRNARPGIVFPLAAAVALAVAGASCSPSRSGRFPYDAAVVDRNDAPATLAPLRGHPVVLAAYAASMPDCRKRIERFVSLSDEFRDAPVRFVAVDISPREADKFPEVVPDRRGSVLFLKDGNGEVRRALKIDITPTTFLVFPDG
ncbi:MAG: peroxiredoxin family protein, partial [Gemmatimonadota bacterium]